MFKDISGYEGLYKISEEGEVFSCRRGKSLKANLTGSGYLSVSLSLGGKVKSLSVHKLVAMTYLDNPNGLLYVNHKDGCKTNNHVSNLEYCTAKENIRHAMDIGLISKERPDGLPVAKIDPRTGEVLEIYTCQSEAGRANNLNHQNISKVVKGERKTTGGYGWQRYNTLGGSGAR